LSYASNQKGREISNYTVTAVSRKGFFSAPRLKSAPPESRTRKPTGEFTASPPASECDRVPAWAGRLGPPRRTRSISLAAATRDHKPS